MVAECARRAIRPGAFRFAATARADACPPSYGAQTHATECHASMTLVHIVIAALAGGVLSTVAAGATLNLDARWIPRFVSFAVGALLGAVFLELLPHALEGGHAPSVMVTV